MKEIIGFLEGKGNSRVWGRNNVKIKIWVAVKINCE